MKVVPRKQSLFVLYWMEGLFYFGYVKAHCNFGTLLNGAAGANFRENAFAFIFLRRGVYPRMLIQRPKGEAHQRETPQARDSPRSVGPAAKSLSASC